MNIRNITTAVLSAISPMRTGATRHLKTRSVLFVALAGASCIAVATPVTIGNQGFELLATPTYTVGIGQIQDWTQTTGDSGLFRPSFYPAAGATFISGVTGDQTAYLNTGSIFQTLGSVLSLGSYTLSLNVGDRADLAAPQYRVELLAGSTVLGFITESVFPTLNNGWITAQVNYAALAGNASLGQQLGIRLTEVGGGQVNFDKVSLDFSTASQDVPEPGSLALVGLAVLALTAIRRRA